MKFKNSTGKRLKTGNRDRIREMGLIRSNGSVGLLFSLRFET